MIKNELIKFFTPLKAITYLGFLLMFTVLPSIIFKDTIIKDPYDFVCGNMNDQLVLVIPIILAIIVSEIFTNDYELGCMKFFIIYKKREKVFLSKFISLFLITAILIAISFMILILTHMVKNPQSVGILYNEIFSISKTMILFIVSMIPILLIYSFISIECKNSMIISLLVFLLIMMSDLFVKFIADITPTRFFRAFLSKGTNVDSFSIILFALYLIIFLVLNISVFSKKEMLH